MVQLEDSREAAEAVKAESGAKRRLTAYNRVLNTSGRIWNCSSWAGSSWRMPSQCKTFRTFAERWNEVLSQLRATKRTVKALFDTPFVNRLAWNVAGEGKVFRIEANQKGNAREGRILRERARDKKDGK
ncbi:hypothetical protein DL764_000201 [Monosporascus ibericus]|uniref:Uncharacterized protein n=1 Tax=Monosporascus ibericus TaxID=155417 RepID=A0A4Q4TUL1_9PEZI|nr:hypothetical protein DL764_000201 [Monosporascus ibericus]